MTIRHSGAVIAHRIRIGNGTLGATPQIQWITPSGVLGVYAQESSINLTLQATSTSSQSIVYSLVSGSLPPNVTLNNYTGVISGSVASDVIPDNYNFVMRAAISNNSIDNIFSIQELYDTPIWITSSNLGTLILVTQSSSITPIQLNASDEYSSTVLYSLTDGALPTNLSLSSTGLLSGIVSISTANTNYIFSVTATNNLGGSTPQSFIYDVISTPPVWQTPTGSLYSINIYSTLSPIQLLATGIDSSLTYSIIDGALPDGLTLSNSGLLYGTVTGSIAYSVFTVSVTDTLGSSANNTFGFNVYDIGPVWSNSGLLGSSSTYFTIIPLQLSAYSPAGTIIYSMTSGSLPEGITLSSSGLIYGTLSSSITGTSDFIVAATDIYNISTSASLSYSVGYSGPVWNTIGNLGSGFMLTTITSLQLDAVDTNGSSITYSLEGGNFPPSLTLSSSGAIAGQLGVVSSLTTYIFTISATDAYAQSSKGSFSYTVYYDAPFWSNATTLGSNYMTATITPIELYALDQMNSSITYALTAGSLPVGLSLDTTGNIYGTLGSVATNIYYTFGITATDAINTTATKTFVYRVLVDIPSWETESDLGNSYMTSTISAIVLSANDYLNSPITYTITSGSLPSGLTIDSIGGSIYGTLGVVSADTTYTFDITATNDISTSSTQPFTYEVLYDAPVWITGPTLGSGYMTTTIAPITLSATDYLYNTITFAITEGSLPVGLAIDTVGGSIYGTLGVVSADTIYSFNITASNAINTNTVQSFTYEVLYDAPVWHTDSELGSSYMTSTIIPILLRATDSLDLPITFTITDGSLPDGLALDTAKGSIYGTLGVVSADTYYTFSVTAINAYSGATTNTFTYEVLLDAPIWNTSSVLGNSYMTTTIAPITVSATDPLNCSITFSVTSGSLPIGLSFDSQGTIYGTLGVVSANTYYTFGITATNTLNKSATNTFTYEVLLDTPSWITGSIHNSSYMTTTIAPIILNASDPINSPITFAVTNGSLPTGLTFDSQGSIYGTLGVVSANTYYTFDITATNAINTSATETFTYEVLLDVPIWITSVIPNSSYMTTTITPITISAYDTLGSSITYAVNTGSLPIGLSFNSQGTIYGTLGVVSANTYYTFGITATNTGNISATKTFTYEVLLDTPSWITSIIPNVAYMTTTIAPITLNASDPINSPITFAVTSGFLPEGLSLNLQGSIYGTLGVVSANTYYTFDITATNAINTGATETFTYEVLLDAPSWITNSSLPASYMSATISPIILSATDHLGSSITYSLSDGSLPPNLILTSSGTIFGTLVPYVSENTNYTFVISATNAFGIITNQTFAYELLYDAPTWYATSESEIPASYMTSTIIPCNINSWNTDPIDSSISYSITSGNLPYGLSLDPAGIVYGTLGMVTVDTTYTFTVTATNALGGVSSAQLVYTELYDFPSWNTNSGLGNGYMTSTIAPIVLHATDPINSPLTFVVTNNSLPNGLTLDPSGSLYGTLGIVLANTSYTFDITVTNALNSSTTRTFTYEILLDTPIWNVTTSLLNDYMTSTITPVLLGNYVNDPVGSVLSYAVIGGSLPPSLTFNSTGTINGILELVSRNTTFSFTIAATNAFSISSTQVCSIEILYDVPTWSTGAVLPSSYTTSTITPVVLTAIDPINSPITYLVTNNSLPDGLTLDPSGSLYGTLGIVSANTYYTFSVTATNALNSSVTKAFSYEISCDMPSWITGTGLGSNYMSVTIHPIVLTATDRFNSPLVYNVSDGYLPDGLTLDQSGSLYGTLGIVSTNTYYTFAVTVSNAFNTSNTKTFSYEILADIPVWTTSSRLLGSTNMDTQITAIMLAATDPLGSPITYSSNDGLFPPNLSLSPFGLISGIIGDASGGNIIYTFSVTASNTYGNSVSRQFSYESLLVSTPPVWQTSPNLGNFNTGEVVNIELVAISSLSISYTLTSGSLPSGLKLAAATGILSGTFHATPGYYSFTVTANVTGSHGAQTFFITPNIVANFMLAGASGFEAISPDGVTWSTVSPGFGTAAIAASCIADSSYILGNNSGQIADSNSAFAWNPVATISGAINNILYAGEIFVAVGNGGLISTSTNGASWTNQTNSFGSNAIKCIAYNGNYGNFVAAGANGNIETSPDGITWTNRNNNIGNVTINGIAYGNNVVVAGCSNGLFYTSSDGINWNTPGLPSSSGWNSIAWNGSVFCAIKNSSSIAATSSDGITWYSQTMPVSAYWTFLIWNGSVFCAIAGTDSASNSSGVSATSQDGVNWSLHSMPVNTTWRNITYGNSVFCAIAYNSNIAAISSDGVTWTRTTLPVSSSWSSIAWNGSVFCAVTYGSNIAAISSDGVTWTRTTMPISTGWHWIAWNGSVFCATDWGSNATATSSDGIHWSSGRFPTGWPYSNWSIIASNGYVFCAIASGLNTSAVSTDGINWTIGTLPGHATWHALTWNGSEWCAMSTNSSVTALSPDGINWTGTVNTFGTNSINAITYGNNIFVAGGVNGVIATSSDGVSWSNQANTFGKNTVNSITYNDNFNLFVAVGNNSNVAVSGNGIDWSAVTNLGSRSLLTVASNPSTGSNITILSWQTAGGLLGSFTAGSTIYPIQLSASEDTSNNITYSISTGALPSGLHMNSAGLIYGTLTNAISTAFFTVNAVDPYNNQAYNNFSIQIIDNGPSWITSGLVGISGAYTTIPHVQFEVSPGVGNTTFSLISGALPPGLTISSSGLLHGTLDSNADGVDFNFSVMATDALGASSIQTLDYIVSYSGPFWNNSPNLGSCNMGSTMVPVQITAGNSNGSNNTYTVISSSLPTGLTISNDLTISGTPLPVTTTTTYEIVASATDAFGQSITGTFSYTVNYINPSWVTSSGNVGTFDVGSTITSTQLIATEPDNSLTYNLVSGTLPPGLILQSNGFITGTLSLTIANYNFTASATDKFGQVIDNTFSINVVNYGPIWNTNSNLAAGCRFTTITPIQFSAPSPIGNVVYNLDSGSTLPAGLTFTSTGLLYGTLTATSGTAYFNIDATDILGAIATNNFNMYIGTNFPSWVTDSVLTSSYMDATIIPIQLAATALNGVSVVYSLIGGSLPTYLELSSSGLISGTLTGVTGNTSHNFTIEATDIYAQSTPKVFSYEVLYDQPTWITENNLGLGTMGHSIIPVQLVTSDPTGSSVYYSLTGTLPANLTLTSTGLINGVLSAVPNTTIYTFTITAINANTGYTTQAFNYQVLYDSPTWITTSSLGSGYMTTTLTPIQLSSVDSLTGSIIYSLTGGTLPPSLSLSSSGLLIGTLNAVFENTTYTFTISATNTIGGYTTQAFNYQVLYDSPTWITTSSLGSGYMTTTLTPIQLTSSDLLSNSLTYSLLAGSLPPSLYLSSSGLISGTLGVVSSNTTYNFTINASNNIGGYTAKGFTYQILHEAPTWVTSSNLGSGLMSSPISPIQLSTTDIIGASVSYSLASGTLPTGLSLSSSGLISGTLGVVSSNTTYNFTVGATDAYNQTTNTAFNYTVKYDAPVWIWSPGTVIGNGYMGYTITPVQLLATDSLAPSIRFSLISITPSTSITVSSSGVVSGTLGVVSSNTTYTVTVAAYNNLGGSTTQTFNVISLYDAPHWISSYELGYGYIASTITPIQLNATDSFGPVTYSLTGGTLPPSLAVNSAGLITGTLAVISIPESYNFTITATNVLHGYTAQGFTYEIYTQAPIWLTSSSLGSGLMSTPITPIQLSSTGVLGSSISYSLASGTLPPNLTLSSAGLISGTLAIVTANTSYNFTINATDIYNQITPNSFSYTINYDAPICVTDVNLGSEYMSGTITPIQINSIDTLGGTVTYSILYDEPIWASSSTLGVGYMTSTLTPIQLVATDLFCNSLTYSLVSGSLAPNLSLSSSGLITGTLGVVSTNTIYSCAISVSNSLGGSITQTFSYEILTPARIWVTSSNLGSGLMSTSITPIQLLTWDIEYASVSYSLIGGTLPPNLTLSSSGLISGTLGVVTAFTAYNFVVNALDTNAQSTNGTFNYTIVYDAPLWLSNTNLGTGYMSTAIAETLSVIDLDASSITYSLTGGTLPPALILDPSGTIYGTLGVVTSNTIYSFTITATNNLGGYSSNTFDITTLYDAPDWNCSSSLGSGYMTTTITPIQVTATDIVAGSVSYMLSRGSLPVGLAINSTGLITGTLGVVSNNTTYNFTIDASNTLGGSTGQIFTYQILYDQPTLLTSSSLGAGYMTTTITPIQLVSSDLLSNSFTYSLVSGSLAPSLSLSSSGLITGTLGVVSTNTTYTCVISISNNIGGNTIETISYEILSEKPAWVTSSSLGAGLMSTPITPIQLSTSDIIGASVSYSLTGGTLPPNLTLSYTGLLSGTLGVVTANTSYNFTVNATDSYGQSATSNFNYIINYDAPSWTSSSSLGSAYMTTTISPIQVTAIDTLGGSISYALLGGFLPPSLTLSSTGLITGTLGVVSSNTTYNFTINASNSIGGYTAQGFTYQILHESPVWVTSSSLGSGLMSSTITPIQLSTTDTVGASISYSLIGGTLPPNLTLSSSGLISGTLEVVTTNTSYNFTINATDSYGQSTPNSFSYIVNYNAPVWVSSSSLGSSYMSTTIVPVQLYVTDTLGGSISYALLSGTLPPSLTLSSTGLITGTLGVVSSNTTYNFTINASNSIGGYTAQGFTYQILYNAPVWSTLSSLGSAYMSTSITPIVLSTTDTYGGYIAYSLTGGTLPPNLTLAPAGTLHGTLGIVSSNTFYNFTITATNVIGGFTAQGFTYEILSESPIWVTSSSLGSGLMGSPITPIQLSSTDIVGASISYELTGGTLPPSLTLSSSGLIFGTLAVVTASTLYNFTVNATDSYGQSTASSFSYTINYDAPVCNTNANLGTLGYMSATITPIQLNATDPLGLTITYTVLTEA